MKLFPLALNLECRPVLVVGAGNVAARKVRALCQCGAQVCVVAPQKPEDFPAVAEFRPKTWDESDLDGCVLVFAATNDSQTNAMILEAAHLRGIWANDASDPENSDFHTAATLRRGEICVAVTTNGQSPVLATHVKDQIAAAIGPEYEKLSALLAGREIPERGPFWRELLKSDVLALLRAGKEASAREKIEKLLFQS